MTFYKDNPSLGLETVTTINRETEYRTNCRRITNKDTGEKTYYIKDKDVFFIDKKWYRLNNKKIAFDNETKQMVVIEKAQLLSGVISFKENGSVVMGCFTPNIYNNCKVLIGGGVSDCQDYKILPSEFKYNPTTGRYEKLISEIIRNDKAYANANYNIDDNKDNFEYLKEVYKNSKILISKDFKVLGKYLGELTYGVELECIMGHIAPQLKNRYGIMVCRDGSLKCEDGSIGPEYVTVPYEGAKGLQTINDLCLDLSKTNVFNHNCALHIHLGNIRKDRAFLVALFKLACLIQNNMFKMFPGYKLDEVKYAGKEKNYCKKLKSYMSNYEGSTKDDYEKYINDNFSTLFQFLLDGHSVPNFNFNRANAQHPEREKWRRKSRYYWINFMNMFFGKRNTIEFRLHTPTLNPQKVINWLFIINSIIRYTENNTLEILKGTKVSMEDLFSVYPKPLASSLLSYYNDRCKYFKEFTVKGDYMCPEEFKNDNNKISELIWK